MRELVYFPALPPKLVCLAAEMRKARRVRASLKLIWRPALISGLCSTVWNFTRAPRTTYTVPGLEPGLIADGASACAFTKLWSLMHGIEPATYRYYAALFH